ncbi:MAG: energy transducer TonB [Paludibacter sp.]|nr:energy transducer TonB [Paludibacter sp.]
MSIKHYISGTRKGKDINQIERDALTDPFLADALEGFDETDGKHSEKIRQIQQQISNSSNKNHFNFKWAAMAAMALIIVGIGGYFAVNQLNKYSKKENTTKEKKQNKSEGEKSIFNTIKIQEQENEQNEFITENVCLTEFLLYLPLKKTKKKPKEETVDNAKILIDFHPDTNIEIVEITENKNVASSDDEHDLSANASSKQTDNSSEKVPNPKNGFISYRNYLTANLKYPTDDECKDSHGTVVVRFTINESGRPVNLRVTKSLCPSCNAEAIRLIQNGPDWTQGNKETSVTVHF